MRAILHFAMRLASALRNPIAFATLHPKKVEAIGLCILLLAAYFQIRADRDQRTESYNRLAEVRYEVEFTRGKVMELFLCQHRGQCSPSDMDQVMSEPGVFEPVASTDLWQILRYVAFAAGSVLIVIGKWFDGKRLKLLRRTK